MKDLFAVYDARVPREADLVTYWHEKARAAIARRLTRRAGLLATQAIRHFTSRPVLESIKRSGGIFFARSDDPWILSGANVHISFVGQDDGNELDRELDGRPVTVINADLTTGVDLTWARRLRENLNASFMADIKGGPFEIDPDTAEALLAARNPDGRNNAEVVRPWVNGQDITGRSRGLWIVDFGVSMSQHDAALYEAPFELVRRRVRPFRQGVRRDSYRTRWWIHYEPRPAMRLALAGFQRFIATPQIAKHRLFVWLPVTTMPDQRLTVIARDDDYTIGVLHSRVHEAWALGTGSQLREMESGFTYTPTTCFETFPFPRPTGEQREAIAADARELVRLRDGWLNPPGLDPAALAQRTLTNLYNERPTWLANAHASLDAAVLAAYGWPADLPDDEILARLLALNLDREPAPLKGTPR